LKRAAAQVWKVEPDGTFLPLCVVHGARFKELLADSQEPARLLGERELTALRAVLKPAVRRKLENCQACAQRRLWEEILQKGNRK
jgi:hypothetical protein